VADIVALLALACTLGPACYLWGRQQAEHAQSYHRARADRLARDLVAVERERDAWRRRVLVRPLRVVSLVGESRSVGGSWS
jgi:uncharacterized protein HemX